MATTANAFAGKASKPTEAEIAAALGKSKKLWDALVKDLSAEHDLQQEWNSSSKKLGWSLRLKQGERNIVYLAPLNGTFMASFALGDRALEAARNSELPARVLKIISEAKRYAEGNAVRIEVRSSEDVAAVKKLVACKAKN